MIINIVYTFVNINIHRWTITGCHFLYGFENLKTMNFIGEVIQMYMFEYYWQINTKMAFGKIKDNGKQRFSNLIHVMIMS